MPNDADKLQPPAPRLMTYKEVAAVLRCTGKTIYNLVRRGDLPAVRFGHSVRIAADDLAAFVERSKGVPQ
jgi:putative molybdopterin biosynthesis protein